MTDLSETRAGEGRGTPLPARLRLPSLNLWGLVVPALALGALEAAGAFGLVPARLMPPPSAILETFRELYNQGLLTHLAVSTARVLAGYALGVALAVPARQLLRHIP